MATVSDQDIVSLTLGGAGQQSAPSQAAGALAAPADYSGMISQTEQKYGLPSGLLGAIITKGENSGASAVSRKGAVGLGQLMPGTAQEMGVTDPTDPAQNIDGSGRYLSQMLARYRGDKSLAVAAYNAGPGAVDDHGGVPPYPETQAYVQRVLGQQGRPQANSSEADKDIVSLTLGGRGEGGPMPNASPAQPGGNAPQASNEIYNPKDADSQYTPAQVKTVQQMLAAKQFDTSNGAYLTHGGEANTPYMQTADGAVPTPPGTYYIDLSGKVQQTAGKPVSAGEGGTQGGIQGLKDISNTIANVDDVSPAFEAALAKSNPLAAQNIARQSQNHAEQAVENKLYDARYGGNGYALLGRIGGNIAGTAPLMAVAPEAGIIGDADAAGNVLGQVGKFALGSAPKGANALVRAGASAVRGAGEGATAAGMTSSASDAPLDQQLEQGALLGGALHLGAPAIRAVGGVVADTVGGLARPLTAPGRNALIMDYLSDTAKGGASDLRPQSAIPGVQRTLAQSVQGGNAGLGALERSLQGSDSDFNNQLTGMAKQNGAARKAYIDTFVSSPEDVQKAKAAQQDVFHKDVMSAMGSPDAAPTQEAMAANKARLGDVFNTVAQNTTIQGGDPLRSTLGDIVNQANQVLPDSEVQPLIKQVQNISDTMKPDGTISGESYQALTRKGSPLDRAMAAKGNVGFYAGQVRDALDDALESSAAPEDLKALKDARTQYRNMKIVEGALPTDPGQSLDPAKLLSKVGGATQNYAYTGGGDLGKAAASAMSRMQSGPVAEQDYLNKLNLTTNGDVPTLDKVNGALKKINKDPAAPVTRSVVNKLTTLRDDLQMDQGSNAGMGRGSNTFQNLATGALSNAVGKAKNVSNILAALGGAGELAASHNPLNAGVAGLAVKGAADMVGNTYAKKNLLIQQALRHALLNPDTVTLATKVPAGSFPRQNPVVNALLQSNAVPAFVDTKNRLLGAK